MISGLNIRGDAYIRLARLHVDSDVGYNAGYDIKNSSFSGPDVNTAIPGSDHYNGTIPGNHYNGPVSGSDSGLHDLKNGFISNIGEATGAISGPYAGNDQQFRFGQAESPGAESGNESHSPFWDVAHSLRPAGLENVAMSLYEFEALRALCVATRESSQNAPKSACITFSKYLADKFRAYLLELPEQRFSAPVFAAVGDKTLPWMVLATDLTLALVSLAENTPVLASKIIATLSQFVDFFFVNSKSLEASHYFSFIGFMKILAQRPGIFTVTESAIKIFHFLDSCVDNEDFLTALQSYLVQIPTFFRDHVLALDLAPIYFVKLLAEILAAISAQAYFGNTDEKPLMERLMDSCTPKEDLSDGDNDPENQAINGRNPNERLDENFDTIAKPVSNTNAVPKFNANAFSRPKSDTITGSLSSNGSTRLPESPSVGSLVHTIAQLALKKLQQLDAGEDYMVYSSLARLRLGYMAKALLLLVITCGVLYGVVELQVIHDIFVRSVGIYDMMLDFHLGTTIVQLGAILVLKDLSVGSSLTRAFTSLVANPALTSAQCTSISKSFGLASKALSQDSVVTTIYALTNLLFVGNDGLQLHARSRRGTSNATRAFEDQLGSSVENANPNRLIRNNTVLRRNSVVSKKESKVSFNELEYTKVCENAVTAIHEVVAACEDESVSTLAVSILSQKTLKMNTTIAPFLLKCMVKCGPYLPEREFVVLVRLLHALTMDAYHAGDSALLTMIEDSRHDLAADLKAQSNVMLGDMHSLYYVYLAEMLSGIISQGDVQELDHHRSHNEISAVGSQIALYLMPLAALLPQVKRDEPPLKIEDRHVMNLFRNIWFNMVVHGYSANSSHAKTYDGALRRIAYSTPPLASETSWNKTETSLELNIVLKRGLSNHNVKDHRHIAGDIFEVPRTMSYSKLMFLAAAVFVESLRVKLGNCHTVLEYYLDPSLKTSGIDKYLGPLAYELNNEFVGLVDCGADKQFSAQNVAEQLTHILTACCHGLEDLQQAAFKCADNIIRKIPSSLCNQRSLFALFDLLTLLYESVVDAEINQFNPTFIFTAKLTGVKLRLPDSNTWRHQTFSKFHEKCKAWVKIVLSKCNNDTKSLIQSYVSSSDRFQSNTVKFGTSFALEMAGSIGATDRELVHLPRSSHDSLHNLMPSLITQLTWRTSFISDVMKRVSFDSAKASAQAFHRLRSQVRLLMESVATTDTHVPLDEILGVMSEVAGYALVQHDNLAELVRYLVEIPFAVFDSDCMAPAVGIWGAVMEERPNLAVLVLSEICKHWERSIDEQLGIFSREHDLVEPAFSKMEYAPSDFERVSRLAMAVDKSFQPHLEIIKMMASNFEATMYQSDHLLKMFTRFVIKGLHRLCHGSLHPYARFMRFLLVRFGYELLKYHARIGSRSCARITEVIFDSSLSWFQASSHYPFGSNALKIKADYTLLQDVAELVAHTSTLGLRVLENKRELLLFFLNDEISKINVWLHPTSATSPTKHTAKNSKGKSVEEQLRNAYTIDPQLAINLAHRYKIRDLDETLQALIVANPVAALRHADAIQYFIGINSSSSMPSYQLLFWEPLAPVDAILLFLPPFGSNAYVLQYTMRSLEHHDVNLTFFYVPQIVQLLRFDAKGYVLRFILETARVLGLFAHQIIWNMMANSYKDEDSTEPDVLKPTLDRIQAQMLRNMSDDDLDFYHKEFGFFEKVTSISGKLKPYIKKSKAEKKVKIDEEMSAIVVEEGVYLPSNPDGVLVDINRKSGKPLQLHAKAPFLATFKIRKDVTNVDEYGRQFVTLVDKWQSAIFKVGDDCRQDVLALQLISVFRTIWLHAGLDLYVFPYRVTATAPGCGVIDVLPNLTSRDMLGREAVNGLYEYYISKFGPESSIDFQRARNNLIRSLAAYSIISFLLQFKDRHNGNIMYDEQGNILHIDFGFCFDIVPGGVKFEVAPFKLTKEMVMVMGGSSTTQAFGRFEELCVKGFLACRPHMETIVRCVTPMLESGLPCFKETTVKKLRKRFVPTKNDRDAAVFFRGLIRKSYESVYTTGYDEFQRLTNGIPY